MQHFHFADQVIALGNQGILEQGDWKTLKFRQQQATKSLFRHYHDDSKLASRPETIQQLGLQNKATSIELYRKACGATLYSEYTYVKSHVTNY